MAMKNVQKKESKKTPAKKNKTASLAWGCWGIFVIIIILAFIVKKDTIFSNLKTTDFFGRLFGSTPSFIENHKTEEENVSGEFTEETFENDIVVLKSDSEIKNTDSVKKSENQSSVKNDTVSEINKKVEVPAIEKKTDDNALKEKQNSIKNDSSKAESKNNESIADFSSSKESKKETVTAKTIPDKNAGMNEISLFFVIIDSDGRVARREIKRSVEKNDSPLTNSIRLLLAGPDVSRKNEKGVESLIPEGTKLLSARVQNGVAYLNFNENFEFNSFGVEGYKHQLEQIVYTATSFSTVKSVQFLIEGEKTEYLGSEGIWIGSPLSRTSF